MSVVLWYYTAMRAKTGRHRFVTALLTLATVIAGALVVLTVSRSPLLDFTIYWSAGHNVLNGLSPYGLFGPHELPFQYLPWIAWVFAPLAALPLETAWRVFALISIGIVGFAVILSAQLHNAAWTIPQKGYAIACALVGNWLLLYVGQSTAIALMSAVVIMALLQADRPCWAGILVPLALVKPNLLLLFIPAVLMTGGRRTLLSAAASTGAIAALALAIYPAWPRDFFGFYVGGIVRNGTLPWNFTTLAGIAGLARTWNYPLAALLLTPSAWLLARARHLPKVGWLSASLALSLVSAPHSFAYDLPMLIPALVGLSVRWSWRTALLWLVVAIAPMLFRFGSLTYLLYVAVAAMSVVPALQPRYPTGYPARAERAAQVSSSGDVPPPSQPPTSA